MSITENGAAILTPTFRALAAWAALIKSSTMKRSRFLNWRVGIAA
ncbi:MAG: hypothetical protein ABL916_05955 [Burkholderiaceae bacterium]